jgi:hypothetical protein
MKISKISALISCAITTAETYIYLDKRVSHDAQYLADAFLSDVMPSVIIGCVMLLLPAMALMFAGPFRNLVGKTSPIYPLLLAAGLWIANSVDDGMAFSLIVVIYIFPAMFAYAFFLFIDGRINRANQRVLPTKI